MEDKCTSVIEARKGSKCAVNFQAAIGYLLAPRSSSQAMLTVITNRRISVAKSSKMEDKKDTVMKLILTNYCHAQHKARLDRLSPDFNGLKMY